MNNLGRRAFLLSMGLSASSPMLLTADEYADSLGGVEPVPTQFDFERPETDGDLSFWQVKDALDRLGWHPGLAPIPLLVVQPSAWYDAEQAAEGIQRELRGRIAIHYATFSKDSDDWFVAWRGRRAGSIGA